MRTSRVHVTIVGSQRVQDGGRQEALGVPPPSRRLFAGLRVRRGQAQDTLKLVPAAPGLRLGVAPVTYKLDVHPRQALRETCPSLGRRL